MIISLKLSQNTVEPLLCLHLTLTCMLNIINPVQIIFLCCALGFNFQFGNTTVLLGNMTFIQLHFVQYTIYNVHIPAVILFLVSLDNILLKYIKLCVVFHGNKTLCPVHTTDLEWKGIAATSFGDYYQRKNKLWNKKWQTLNFLKHYCNSNTIIIICVEYVT